MSMLDFSGAAGGAGGETTVIQQAEHGNTAGGVVNIINFLEGDLINAGG